MEKRERSVMRVVIIGGSAGSLDVLLSLLPSLKNFRIPLVIVLHRRAAADDTLADLLASKASLKIKEVEDKDPLQPGTACIAPGDYHLLFEKEGSLSLDDSEKVAFSRPSIDVSFQSAAAAYGAGVISILLSGANADGTEGALAVREAGGISLVQRPQTAAVAFMPQRAIDAGAADEVLDVAGIAAYLNGLSR